MTSSLISRSRSRPGTFTESCQFQHRRQTEGAGILQRRGGGGGGGGGAGKAADTIRAWQQISDHNIPVMRAIQLRQAFWLRVCSAFAWPGQLASAREYGFRSLLGPLPDA